MVVKIAGGGFGTGSQGVVQVFSQDTGEVDTILCDKAYLTDCRTAAAGALCCRLSVPRTGSGKKGFGNGTVGIVGSGVQARFQATYISHILGWTSVLIAARNAERRASCVAELAKQLAGADITVGEAESVEELCSSSHVIVTTTSAKEPVLAASLLPKSESGCVVIAMGADGIGKHEVAQEIIAKADRVIVDSLEQCKQFGDLSYLAEVPANTVELGKVVKAAKAGDESFTPQKGHLTVCDLTGRFANFVFALRGVHLTHCTKELQHRTSS